jgi:hypothetical protein
MAREHLANRRLAVSFSLEFRGLGYTVTVGRFPDGRPAECFLNNHKVNSATDIDGRDAAIILSFALQHGADLQEIARALSRDPQGQPTGLMGAVIDLVLEEAMG